MSLLQRVERAQHGADIPNAGALVPVGPGAPPKPAPSPAREELLRDIRVRLLDELIRAFAALHEVPGAADARSKIEGTVDRAIDTHGFL